MAAATIATVAGRPTDRTSGHSTSSSAAIDGSYSHGRGTATARQQVELHQTPPRPTRPSPPTAPAGPAAAAPTPAGPACRSRPAAVRRAPRALPVGGSARSSPRRRSRRGRPREWFRRRRSSAVASGRTTAGIPISRATTAPWDSAPPHSRTSAAAFTNSGVHAGRWTGRPGCTPGRSSPASVRRPDDPRRPGATPEDRANAV